MAKAILSNEWTAAIVGLAVLGLHLWWFAGSKHQGDVLTGAGGFLAALGIFVAGQPYIRKGLIKTAREQVGLQDTEESRQIDAHEDEAEKEGVRHVLKERVVGVLLIAAGSMLNGYGVAIARLLSLKGP